MMQKLTLTLTLPSSANPPETRSFSGAEVSIGRATGNDWVLADADRNLSRRHCVIRFVQGQYWLEDTSANGV
ncbi:MAG: FHA domain-containing protein [Rhodospirillaceae bacterium]